MKNLFILILLITGLLQPVIAQEDMPIVVISTTGKIKGKLENGKKATLQAGAIIQKGALVTIPAGGELLLYHNNRFTKINTPGKKALKEMFMANIGPSSLNYDNLFGEFIKAAAATSDLNHQNINRNNKVGDGWGVTDPKKGGGWGVNDPKKGGGWGVTDPKKGGGWGVTDPKKGGGWGVTDPKKGGGWGVTDPKKGGGWGVTDPKKGGGWGVEDPKKGGGWGEEAWTLISETPGGLYVNGNESFSWLSTNPNEEFEVFIFNDELAVVKSYKTSTNKITINLAELGLDPTKAYYWQVSNQNGTAITPPMSFMVLTTEAYNDIINIVQDSDIFSGANPSVQGLMKATSLEYNKLYAETFKVYEGLLQKDPKNILVKMSYSSFCLRMGKNAKAVELLEK